METRGTKIIACATVIEEILPIISPEMSYEVLDFGLHVRPEELKKKLQDTIDNSPEDIKNIVLGYGLCSQAVVGLKSERATLVIPNVDDCISIFLGSEAAHRKEHRDNPGTYYLTKGWLKTNGTVFDEYDKMVAKYGATTADRLMRQILKNYTRLVFINTGVSGLGEYRERAREMARRFMLNYEEIDGSDILIKKMISGQWDKDFLIVKPGRKIVFTDFRKPGCGAAR